MRNQTVENANKVLEDVENTAGSIQLMAGMCNEAIIRFLFDSSKC